MFICNGGKGAALPMLFLAVVLSCFLFSNPVSAATQAEIVAQATAEYAAGRSIQDVVAHALAAAAASDIAFDSLAPALAESLMQAGIQSEAEGISLSGQITSAMLSALMAQGADNPTVLRTVSQMVEGIRAASDRAGLNADAVRAQIGSVLSAVGGTGEFGTQLVQVLNAAYSEAHAETYTTPPRQSPPPVPGQTSSQTAIPTAYDAKPSKF